MHLFRKTWQAKAVLHHLELKLEIYFVTYFGWNHLWSPVSQQTTVGTPSPQYADLDMKTCKMLLLSDSKTSVSAGAVKC